MRCPKCGYNSFDHLDNCKKCGKDLSEHKAKFGIKNILLSGVVLGTERPEEIAENSELDAAVSLGEVAAESPVETAAAESDDLGFDFMGESEDDDELAFDELFEESSLEDDIDETLPAPNKMEETLRDDHPTFDLGESDTLESDFGLETNGGIDESSFDLSEPESLESLSLDTDLGLASDTDFTDFGEDDSLGTKEGPKRPFDCEEAPLEEPPTADAAVGPEISKNESGTHLAKAQAEPQSATDESFVAADDFKADLFADDEDLTLQQDAIAEEPVLESLESSFGDVFMDQAPSGASDDFSLGALPAAQLSERQETGAAEISEKIEDIDPTDDEGGDVLEAADSAPPPFGRRVGAFLCDMVLLGLVGFCFIIVAETALSENTEGLFPSLKTLIDLSIPYFLVVFCLTFGYFTLFHFLAGQTPGKMVAGIQVETTSGGSLSLSQAFVRSVGGLVQLLPVGLGYLSVLFNREGRGWNDRLAATRLIDLKIQSQEQEQEEQELQEEG